MLTINIKDISTGKPDMCYVLFTDVTWLIIILGSVGLKYPEMGKTKVYYS